MFVIGLTGGIASGKSTVSAEFIRLGVPVIDADVIAREVVEPGKRAWQRICHEFGDHVILKDGKLDRVKLGSIIFNDPSLRSRLNSFTHPEIRREMVKRLFYLILQGHRFAVVDVPLLFESYPRRLVKLLSYVLVVNCPEPIQIERLMDRDDLTREEAISRLRSQLPLGEKCNSATNIIDNSGTIDHTKEQVRELYEEFCQSQRYVKVRLVVFLMFILWLLLMYTVARTISDFLPF